MNMDVHVGEFSVCIVSVFMLRKLNWADSGSADN